MPRNSVAYDDDFFAWTQEQARLLRNGELSQLDIENVAEELESMGRRDRREIESRLEVLIMHLLKWQIQIRMRGPSWIRTIREQRRRVQKLLRDSPSLKPIIPQLIAEAYPEAREIAADEAGLPETASPAICPYLPEQILGEDFLPD